MDRINHEDDIEGVKSVKNEMTMQKVEKSAQTATGKSSVVAMSKPLDWQQQAMVNKDKTRIVGGKIDDASVTTMVKTSLLYHHSTRGLKTTVTTKNGYVTLEGQAKNSTEKELATRYAKDVRGVMGVDNNISVL